MATLELCLDILFNIYMSKLVRLEGELVFQVNPDFQTLNLGFPGPFSPNLSAPKIMFLVPENEKRNKFPNFSS